VPTLKGGAALERCLLSLRGQTVPVEVVVADNGPGQGCRDLLEDRFPEVTRVTFGENLGFGKALNRAIAAHGTGPIILLNDDAVAEPGFSESLLDAFSDGHPAMVAAVMTTARGTIDSAGVVADSTLLGFDYLTGRPVSDLEGATDPLGPTGGGALYDRESFDAVGGFDENIFLYYEDLDLALRIRANGGICRLAAGARAAHGYSETLGAGNPAKYGFTGWSRGYILGRYRILRRPLDLVKVLIVEGAVCLGQLLTARTVAGLRSRVTGWRAGRILPPREITDAPLVTLGAVKAVRLKLARRSQ